jgi:hypothetical protein
MNPRIREIAIKSQLVYDDNGELLTCWMSHVDLSEVLEKFAESIVMECMRLSVIQSDASYVSNYIAKHFGVE